MHARYPTAEIEALAEELAGKQEAWNARLAAIMAEARAKVAALGPPPLGWPVRGHDARSTLALLEELGTPEPVDDEAAWERARDEEMAL